MAPRIIISDGAAFRGRIDMQNFEEGRDAHKHHAPTPTPPPAAHPPHTASPAK
jgi:hypothetical protein